MASIPRSDGSNPIGSFTLLLIGLLTVAAAKELNITSLRDGVLLTCTPDVRHQAGEWTVLMGFDSPPGQKQIRQLLQTLRFILRDYRDSPKIMSNHSAVMWLKRLDDLSFLTQPYALHRDVLPREKRGLFNFGGEVLRFLFGTATEDQVNQMNQMMRHTAEQQRAVIHVVDNLVTVVNKTSWKTGSRSTVCKKYAVMALKGLKVIELAGLAPAPFCGMILADFGAQVIRVDKAGSASTDSLCRGKKSIVLNLKKPEGVSVLRKLCSSADVLVEPFRKGVMEKLGLGPDQLLNENPRLIYARMTGYGQDGPLSDRAGHDINYLAISGLLSMLGRKGEKPYAPINLMGDFAGGGLICALGIVMALMERTRSGQGQVVDANMVEGANYVGSFVYTLRDRPMWGTGRGTGILDGGVPWYETYKTKDDKFVSVGAIEPQFYDKLITGLGLTHENTPQFGDMEATKAKFADIFASKTQAEWCKVFDDVDACVAPIIPWDEAADYRHNKARGSFMKNESGLAIPTPAPRLSRTPAQATTDTYLDSGLHSQEILSNAGFSQSDIAGLVDKGVVEDCGETRSKL